MYFARAHANRFYNFWGLEQFRVKMSPKGWEPIYAISNEPRFAASTLYESVPCFRGFRLGRPLGLVSQRHLAKKLARSCRTGIELGERTTSLIASPALESVHTAKQADQLLRAASMQHVCESVPVQRSQKFRQRLVEDALERTRGSDRASICF